jgi:hypothetical protein
MMKTLIKDKGDIDKMILYILFFFERLQTDQTKYHKGKMK